MKYTLPLSIIVSAFVMAAVSPLHAQDISGDWQGTLTGSAAGRDLRLVLRISRSDSGWSGKFYSIDQPPINAVAVTALTLKQADFRFSIADLHVSYAGRLSADGSSVEGTWTGIRTLSLEWQRSTKDTAWNFQESPVASGQSSDNVDDSNVRPPITDADLRIAKRARELLDSPSKWNRADNRQCPTDAKAFSLYCALETATIEIGGKFEHRGAALQEARFIIDEIAIDRNYGHRLMDYNNDPTTSFADIQEILRTTESLIQLRLKTGTSKIATSIGASGSNEPGTAAKPTVAKSEVEIIKRVRVILSDPAKWNRKDTQECADDVTTLSLYCALVKAATEITGAFDNSGTAIQEVRLQINETPNHKSYGSRLRDFNNDPTVTFGDLQKLLQAVQERLEKGLNRSNNVNRHED